MAYCAPRAFTPAALVPYADITNRIRAGSVESHGAAAVVDDIKRICGGRIAWRADVSGAAGEGQRRYSDSPFCERDGTALNGDQARLRDL